MAYSMFGYGKWDEPEDVATAFEKVTSGEWDKDRFEEWASHMKTVAVRDATADESY